MRYSLIAAAAAISLATGAVLRTPETPGRNDLTIHPETVGTVGHRLGARTPVGGSKGGSSKQENSKERADRKKKEAQEKEKKAKKKAAKAAADEAAAGGSGKHGRPSPDGSSGGSRERNVKAVKRSGKQDRAEFLHEAFASSGDALIPEHLEDYPRPPAAELELPENPPAGKTGYSHKVVSRGKQKVLQETYHYGDEVRRHAAHQQLNSDLNQDAGDPPALDVASEEEHENNRKLALRGIKTTKKTHRDEKDLASTSHRGRVSTGMY